MADVHNVKQINQLDVTFSTEMKGRHSLIIAAVFVININSLYHINIQKSIIFGLLPRQQACIRVI